MEMLAALAGILFTRSGLALAPTFGRLQTKNMLNTAFAAETQAIWRADFLEAQR